MSPNRSRVGVLLAAAYMLWMMLRVVLGEPSYKVEGIEDATALDRLLALTGRDPSWRPPG